MGLLLEDITQAAQMGGAGPAGAAGDQVMDRIMQRWLQTKYPTMTSPTYGTPGINPYATPPFNPNSPIDTSTLDALSAQNKADEGLADKFLRPVFGKLGGIGNVGNKALDVLGEVQGAARASALRGGLGAIAPNFSRGVREAANMETDRAYKRALTELVQKQAQAASAPQNPVNAIPPGVLSKLDPVSVVRAIQSGDISQLKSVGPDAPDVNKVLNDLGDDIRTESTDFAKIKESYGRIAVVAENPSPAGDLALIFNYMKVLDPGSTVREGEFANAQNSGSVPTRIQAIYNSVLEGTRLSESQREDFLRQAQRQYNAAAKNQRERNDRFRQRALNANVPELLIDPILPSADDIEIISGAPPEMQKRLPNSDEEAPYVGSITNGN